MILNVEVPCKVNRVLSKASWLARRARIPIRVWKWIRSAMDMAFKVLELLSDSKIERKIPLFLKGNEG